MSRVTAERVSSGASIKKRRGFNRVPGTTYRLQFHSGFTLAQARELVSYLELQAQRCAAQGRPLEDLVFA